MSEESTATADYQIIQIQSGEVDKVYALLTLFGDVFEEAETYLNHQPAKEYLIRLMDSGTFLVVVALAGSEVVAGLTVYELTKFEQERTELFIYDLAVHPDHRRNGLATSMIEKVKSIAVERGSHLVFIQSEAEDEPSSSTYMQFAKPLTALHFEFRPESSRLPE